MSVDWKLMGDDIQITESGQDGAILEQFEVSIETFFRRVDVALGISPDKLRNACDTVARLMFNELIYTKK